jgi:DNA primase
MGTAMSEHQIAALKRLANTVVLMFDADEAGAQALLRAGELAAAAGLIVRVASPPTGSDPASWTNDDGAGVLRQVDRAQAFARTLVTHHLERRAELNSAEEKDRVVDELRGVFANIPAGAVREDLVAVVAECLELEPRLLRGWLLPCHRLDELPEGNHDRVGGGARSGLA